MGPVEHKYPFEGREVMKGPLTVIIEKKNKILAYLLKYVSVKVFECLIHVCTLKLWI